MHRGSALRENERWLRRSAVSTCERTNYGNRVYRERVLFRSEKRYIRRMYGELRA